MLVILASAVYITMGDDARIRVDDDKSTFYVQNENNRWVVAGREYNKLFDGSSRMNRRSSSIEVTTRNYTFNNTQFVEIVRTTGYIRGPRIVDTYNFNSESTDIEQFPISHKVEIYNASGYFYRYEVRDLVYDGTTYKLNGELSIPFGRSMNVEIHPDYRWAWVYKTGILTAQYDIPSDYEVFNVRLFDPIIVDTGTPGFIVHNVGPWNITYYNDSAYASNLTFATKQVSGLAIAGASVTGRIINANRYGGTGTGNYFTPITIRDNYIRYDRFSSGIGKSALRTYLYLNSPVKNVWNFTADNVAIDYGYSVPRRATLYARGGASGSWATFSTSNDVTITPGFIITNYLDEGTCVVWNHTDSRFSDTITRFEEQANRNEITIGIAAGAPTKDEVWYMSLEHNTSDYDLIEACERWNVDYAQYPPNITTVSGIMKSNVPIHFTGGINISFNTTDSTSNKRWVYLNFDDTNSTVYFSVNSTDWSCSHTDEWTCSGTPNWINNLTISNISQVGVDITYSMDFGIGVVDAVILIGVDPDPNLPPEWDPVPTDQTNLYDTPFNYSVSAYDDITTGMENIFVNDTTNFKITTNGTAGDFSMSAAIENDTGLSIGKYYLNITANDTEGKTVSETIEIWVQDAWIIVEVNNTNTTWIEAGDGTGFNTTFNDLAEVWLDFNAPGLGYNITNSLTSPFEYIWETFVGLSTFNDSEWTLSKNFNLNSTYGAEGYFKIDKYASVIGAYFNFNGIELNGEFPHDIQVRIGNNSIIDLNLTGYLENNILYLDSLSNGIESQNFTSTGTMYLPYLGTGNTSFNLTFDIIGKSFSIIKYFDEYYDWFIPVTNDEDQYWLTNLSTGNLTAIELLTEPSGNVFCNVTISLWNMTQIGEDQVQGFSATYLIGNFTQQIQNYTYVNLFIPNILGKISLNLTNHFEISEGGFILIRLNSTGCWNGNFRSDLNFVMNNCPATPTQCKYVNQSWITTSWNWWSSTWPENDFAFSSVTDSEEPSFKFYFAESPTDIFIDAGSDGSFEWNITSPDKLNTTTQINITNTEINSYLSSNCLNSKYCDYPILFLLNSGGLIESRNINGSMEMPSIDFSSAFRDRLNDTNCPGNYNTTCNVMMNISASSNGTVKVSEINISYRGKSNYTILVHNNDYSVNDTAHLIVTDSNFSIIYPNKVSFWSVYPSSNNQKNVTPYGQSGSQAIWNISSQAYWPVNYTLKLAYNITNITIGASTTENRTQGQDLDDSPWLFGSLIEAIGSQRLWTWVDLFNVNTTLFRKLGNESLFGFEARCSECI